MGPYYRFPIEKLDKTKQHNMLVDLATKGEEVYYCAPIFVGRYKLEMCSSKDEVIDMSRYFDPLSMGLIVDFDQHHVSCDPDGTYGYFHSDPIKLDSVNTWDILTQKAKIKSINMHYVESLSEILNNNIHDAYGVSPSVPDSVKKTGIFLSVSYMLYRYYNLKWFIY